VSWPSWLTCSRRFTHLSAAGWEWDTETSPVPGRRSTTVPRKQSRNATAATKPSPLKLFIVPWQVSYLLQSTCVTCSKNKQRKKSRSRQPVDQCSYIKWLLQQCMWLHVFTNIGLQRIPKLKKTVLLLLFYTDLVSILYGSCNIITIARNFHLNTPLCILRPQWRGDICSMSGVKLQSRVRYLVIVSAICDCDRQTDRRDATIYTKLCLVW